MSDLFHDEGPPATGRKIMLATTAYDRPSAAHVFAIARSRQALHDAGIQTAYALLQGNCHVDDARNAIVRDFLASDCAELVFLDADVDWEPEQLVRLCGHDLDLVGGVYPYRREGGDTMPVRMKPGARIGPDGILEVEGLPTGFMRIRRRVLERVAQRSPKYWDKLDLTALVFDRPDPDEEGTRWGGDIAFCRKWAALGGRLYADAEMRLGHTATIVVRDSLAAQIRRLSGSVWGELIPRFRAGTERPDDYNEIARAVGNSWAADPGVLAVLVGVVRKCRGDVIETGSGLSSVIMGAVSSGRVYSLEHLPHFAANTVAMCEEAGVANVGVCCAPMAADHWYDVGKFDLPRKFALGFCDGPPRAFGTRFRFFEELAPRCEAIVADDIKTDANYARRVREWAEANGRTMQILGRAALVLKPHHMEMKEAA